MHRRIYQQKEIYLKKIIFKESEKSKGKIANLAIKIVTFKQLDIKRMSTQPDVYELLILNERKDILFHYDLVNDKESDENKIQNLEKQPRIQNLSGLIAALKELNKKFSPYPTQNVKFFKSTFYKFSLYDTPGGIKIILLSANNDQDYSDLLEEIYQTAYIDLAQRNPLYQSNTIIKNNSFTNRIKSIFSNLQTTQQYRPM